MLAIVVYDADGTLVASVPRELVFAELAASDYVALLTGEPLSRFHPEFPLARHFVGVGEGERTAPVLEVALPLSHSPEDRVLGFAQYYLDARALSAELAAIDRRVNAQTIATLAIGVVLISGVLAAAYLGLRRAQQTIAERNEGLKRANFELTLAAKASALGQITSHLIHGLQGSVAGLRAVVAGRGGQTGDATPDWQTAATYAERMQSMIHEAVGLLSDASSQTIYELTGRELVETIRARNVAFATDKGVRLSVREELTRTLDNHRGSLLCLIAANLVHNAIEATPPARGVDVSLREEGDAILLTVADEGRGIPDAVRARLFEPGVSGRSGGTGLGLAISRLLARQIGAELALVATGPGGTTFRVTVRAQETGA
jgi:signal transduction histidine kinase